MVLFYLQSTFLAVTPNAQHGWRVAYIANIGDHIHLHASSMLRGGFK